MQEQHLKIPFLFVFILTGLLWCHPNVQAQTINTSKTGGSFANNWVINLNTGFSQFYGDVSSHSYFKKFSKETSFSPDISIRKMFNPIFGVGLSFYYSGLSSIKDTRSGSSVDYSLSGHYNDASLFLYLNISNLLFKYNSERKITIYGTLGLGYGTWNSLLTDNISGISIQSGSMNGTTTFATKSMVIPVGLGLNYRLSEHWGINLGGELRTIMNDDVDVWHDGSKYDQLFNTKVGLTYFFNPGWAHENSKKSDRKKKNECGGETLILNKAPIPIYDYTYHQDTESAPARTTVDLMQIKEPKGNRGTSTRTDNGFRDFEFRVQIMAKSNRLANPNSLQAKYHLNYPVLENFQDGLYRYSTGSFNSYQDALAHSRKIKSQGIFDAFVVAYSHGKRISLTKEMKTMTWKYQPLNQSSEQPSSVIY